MTHRVWRCLVGPESRGAGVLESSAAKTDYVLQDVVNPQQHGRLARYILAHPGVPVRIIWVPGVWDYETAQSIKRDLWSRGLAPDTPGVGGRRGSGKSPRAKRAAAPVVPLVRLDGAQRTRYTGTPCGVCQARDAEWAYQRPDAPQWGTVLPSERWDYYCDDCLPRVPLVVHEDSGLDEQLMRLGHES